jgi:hypothetical protein
MMLIISLKFNDRTSEEAVRVLEANTTFRDLSKPRVEAG